MKNNINNFETAITTVIESSQMHARSTELGDYKTANKSYNEINKAILFLIKNDKIKILENLLTYEDISVQIWVASYLIRLDDQKAIDVLERIASKAIRHHSFDAKMVLQEWKKGNLKL